MINPSESSLISQNQKTTRLSKIAPKTPPTLIEQWVVWELKGCICTNGTKFTTAELHDFLKSDLEQQGVPVNIFFAQDASWIIQGARGTIKLDNDRRPRVVATLQNSPYTDIQFITGIDYFGSSEWADIQMMLIVQPEEVPEPKRPIQPFSPNVSPLLPNEALFVLAVVVILLFLFAGDAGKLFGLVGAIGGILIYIQSNTNVKEAKDRHEKARIKYQEDLSSYEIEKEKNALEREERIKNRVSRSFKTDDLQVFREVMFQSVRKIVKEQLIDKGASANQFIEENKLDKDQQKKNIFDEF